jgi:UDP-N-acetylglucosamine 2-epimerase
MADVTPLPVVIVLGNRPQFVKHAALNRAWGSVEDTLRPIVVDTGQHNDYGLAGIFLDELAIPEPDYALGIGSASHAEMLARMMPPLEELLQREKPALVVVYGDNNSTLGGALAAAQLGIPVAHIEAGLRSFDRSMPEELNRVLVDHASSLLLCPTQTAVENLAREGVTDGVHLVGDVMADIALGMVDASERRWAAWEERGLEDGEYAVVTVHRASNTEPDALERLIDGFERVDLELVFPTHPRTLAALERSGLHVRLTELPNVTMLPPLGYLDLTAVVRHARCVLTDSGGLQKEAYVHGIPCVTLRDTSEWVETIGAGMNVLVHTDPELLVQAVEATAGQRARMADGLEPLYGTGDASEKILALLAKHAQAARILLP